ncbi:ion channel [Colwellia sp. PAMC 21821]|uniref:ion channel n=1 Tax=Colwellia sp. PAMC 21821 TaxID=1816219 RepID=UPI0009C3DA5C|nr:ion channel [Colwellia sp. PAMC 21821]ARD45088.1 voltage-gated potassium channel [Colwellia sp. PAMC 21821]
MIVVQKAMEKTNLYRVDDFGVKNYNYGFIGTISLFLFLTLNLSLGYITYQAELGLVDSPVKSYADAIWLMVMSSTTIGFGDVYPISFVGRASVFIMFILGIGLLGGMGAVFVNKIFGFADTNIKNRELRMQNSQIIAQNTEINKKLLALEEKLEALTKSLNK